MVTGCAASQRSRPETRSAASFEALAEQEELEASRHMPPSAVRTTAGTLSGECRDATGAGTVPCPPSTVKSTLGEPDEAQKHMQRATEYRTRAAKLRAAETQACAHLPETDVAASPFASKESIVGIRELRGRAESAKYGVGPTGSVQGASIMIRAEPGMTKEYLQRKIDCHLARNATAGFSRPDMAFCPLAVRGAAASVSSEGATLRIDITSDEPSAAEEIRARAQRLGVR